MHPVPFQILGGFTPARFSSCSRRRVLAVAVAAGVAALSPLSTHAQQDWPQKPIRLVVPFPPGGSADTLGRLIAKHLGEAFRQTIVVENKAGAGGIIGSQLVTKAAPDGYTMVISGIASHVIARSRPRIATIP